MSAPVTYPRADPARRALQRVAATRSGSWLFATVLARLDRPVYRLTGGRHTAANLLSGLPVVLLTTTGARSGLPRTVPVVGFATTGGLAVIASNFGRAQHPGWYHNLRAHPDAQLVVDRSTRYLHAVETAGEERARIWRQALDIYPGWSAYEQRAGDRQLAVFLLTPSCRPA